MNTTNLPEAGQGVKSPRKFRPTAAFKSTHQTKVADLAKARKEKEEAAEREAAALEEASLDARATDIRTGKRKPMSLQSIFAARLCRGYGGIGQWACQSTEATGSVIHRWTGFHWRAVSHDAGTGLASDWVEKHANHAADDGMSVRCWLHAARQLGQRNKMPEFNPKRAIVPCGDVYIEVLPAGFQALDPDPALGMTHAIKIKTGAIANRPYRPKALPENSKFYKFLARAQPNPAVRALLQEQCGLTLLPGNYSQAAWWYGAAGSGKSTLAELVEAMHRQSVRLNLETLSDRFSLEPLVGASLILVDEVECEKWSEGRFKSLVSGNGVPIDRKFEKGLASYHSRAKWLITSNSPPFVRDKSDGVWRRLAVVHWGVKVPDEEKENDFHLTLLAEEGQIILDWMLEGARRIVKRGRAMGDADMPEEARRAKQLARNNCDSVRAWASEQRVSFQPGCWMPLATTYDYYQEWCTAQGYLAHETLTPRQFWRGMSEAGLIKPDRKSNRRIEGVQTPCYEVQILGSLADLALNWASAAEATTQTDHISTAQEVYANFEAWAKQRIEGNALRPGNLLDQDEFLTALTHAGFIDRTSPVRKDEREGWYLRFVEAATIKEKKEEGDEKEGVQKEEAKV